MLIYRQNSGYNDSRRNDRNVMEKYNFVRDKNMTKYENDMISIYVKSH